MESKQNQNHGKPDMELGVQPLDQFMASREWTNHDLVAASAQGLTHKMVAKGRKGRKLTWNVQSKILNAVTALCPGESFEMKDLFTYTGKR